MEILAHEQEFLMWFGRTLLKGMLIISFTWVLIEYLWENREYFKLMSKGDFSGAIQYNKNTNRAK